MLKPSISVHIVTDLTHCSMTALWLILLPALSVVLLLSLISHCSCSLLCHGTITLLTHSIAQAYTLSQYVNSITDFLTTASLLLPTDATALLLLLLIAQLLILFTALLLHSHCFYSLLCHWSYSLLCTCTCCSVSALSLLLFTVLSLLLLLKGHCEQWFEQDSDDKCNTTSDIADITNPKHSLRPCCISFRSLGVICLSCKCVYLLDDGGQLQTQLYHAVPGHGVVGHCSKGGPKETEDAEVNMWLGPWGAMWDGHKATPFRASEEDQTSGTSPRPTASPPVQPNLRTSPLKHLLCRCQKYG